MPLRIEEPILGLSPQSNQVKKTVIMQYFTFKLEGEIGARFPFLFYCYSCVNWAIGTTTAVMTAT